ncbi:cytochrome P450 [Streptomyces sp. 5.8]|uniref:cytochrome P450 n=1 Tax=Streptomyces sp. 5.8 TaxID=3406571 RepID=UPI003BB7F0A1
MRAINRAPGALPVLGHLRQLLQDPTGFLSSLPAHGDLVEIRLGSRPTYVVCGPDLASRVLVKEHRRFDKGGPFFDNIALFFGDGLATCPNAKHTRLRRLTQPAFHAHQLADYSSLLARESDIVLGSWQEGQVMDTYPVMQELALRITVSTMFASWFTGADAEPEAVGETLGHVNTLVAGAFLRMVAPSVARLPLPANRRFDQARTTLYAKIDATIDAYRRDDRDHGDLLSMLIAPDGTDDALSDREVREQVMTMFIAGIGTTASMLGWALHYLSRNPDLDALVAAEVHRTCGTEPVGHHHLAGLPTLAAVVTETFRIRPAAWMFSRVAVSDADLGGYRIPAGADVLISPYVLHHRPDLFPDPERFDHTRWDGHGRDAAQAERAGTLIPFGTGPRKCVGREFALMNITLALAAILRTWRLTPATPAPVGICGRAIIEPRGLALRLHHRPAPSGPRQAENADEVRQAAPAAPARPS